MARIFIQVAEQSGDGAEPVIVMDLDLRPPVNSADAQALCLSLAARVLEAAHSHSASAIMAGGPGRMPTSSTPFSPTSVPVPAAGASKSRAARGEGSDGRAT
jgi:hypothetical protein